MVFSFILFVGLIFYLLFLFSGIVEAYPHHPAEWKLKFGADADAVANWNLQGFPMMSLKLLLDEPLFAVVLFS